MKTLTEINKFYVMLTAVCVVIAALIIFVFRGIFSAITTAQEVDLVDSNKALKINKEKLDSAYLLVTEKGQKKAGVTATPVIEVESEP